MSQLGSETPIDKDIAWPELKKARFAGYAYITEHPESIVAWFDKHMA